MALRILFVACEVMRRVVANLHTIKILCSNSPRKAAVSACVENIGPFEKNLINKDMLTINWIAE